MNPREEQDVAPRLHVPATCTLLLLVLLSCLQAFAQTYPFKSYSTADGLPQATIGRIFQDSRGFLWIGTHGGVSRYDGVEFTNYLTRGAERSIINDIWEDQEGTMWFATHGNGLAFLKQEDTVCTWMKSEEGVLPDDFVECIFRDNQGSVWIGTNGGVAVMRAGGGVRVYDVSSGLPHNRVRSVGQSHEGMMLLGTSGGLISASLKPDETLESKMILQKAVRSLLVRENGDIVVGTRFNGVFLIRPQEVKQILAAGKIEALCEDSRGILWSGGGGGVHFWEGEREGHIGSEQGLESTLVGELAEDREGTLWIGTGDGLMKLGPLRFMNYSPAQGLMSPIVISMSLDQHGDVWIGKYNGLARVGIDGKVVGNVFNELLGIIVHALAEGVDGKIWIGTNGGLRVVSRGSLTRQAIPGMIPGEAVTALLPQPDGALWIGARGKILRLFNGQTTFIIGREQGLNSDAITTLFIDGDGTLWFGTSSTGVGYFKNGEIRFLGKADGLPALWVHSILQDFRGRIWVTTHRGVVIWQGGRFRPAITSVPSLESGLVNCVVEDSMHRLWFGTDDGVYGWADSVLQHVNTQDGLIADIVHKIVVDPRGYLWFGTHDGVSRVDMKSLSSFISPPAVYFRRVTAGERSLSLASESNIAYQDRTMMFSFNSLSFVDERNIQFQWKLEGFDAGWLTPQKQRQVRYTNLEPGSYAFIVRSANRRGVWSAPTHFAFTVLSPFWRTWWFLTLVVFVTITSMTLAYRYRVNQLLKVERIRTRIATDLHDDIGASLSRIALFSEVAKEEASKVSPRLHDMSQKIGDNARELLDAVGTLVWSIDPRHDRFQDVVTHMKNFAQDMFAVTGIDYSLEVHPDVERLHLQLEARKNLLLIFKEAVNNVVRHSKCKSVRLQLSIHDGTLEMVVADDGTGLPLDGEKDGHGLANMKNRAASMGGECLVLSAKERGTRVEVSLPLQERKG